MRYPTTLAPLLAALLAGCGGPKTTELTMHPVAGKVIYDGKPAAGVRVSLMPVDAPMVPKIPHNPHAITGPDGTFVIGTFTEDDGAAEGGYQVTLGWPADPTEKGKVDTSDEAKDTDRLYGWYDPLHSTLNLRVKAGPNEVPTINIPKRTGPPPKSEGVPGRN